MAVCIPSNPISSNQVKEVNLIPPGCAPNLTDLNSWLKWLAEAQCQTDWQNVNLSCLSSYLTVPTEQTQATVIQTLIDAACKSISCCVPNIQTITTLYPNTPYWNSTGSNPLRALKQGKLVFLQGTLVEGTSTTQPLTFLPEDLRPTNTLRFTVAHSYPITGLYELLVEVRTTGEVFPIFNGTEPVANANIFLNGISYFQL